MTVLAIIFVIAAIAVTVLIARDLDRTWRCRHDTPGCTALNVCIECRRDRAGW